jgi:CubicO group peptidase (beta-lactamase class C family)
MSVEPDIRFRTLIDGVRKSRERQFASCVSLWVWQSDKLILNWIEGLGVGSQGMSPIKDDSRFNIYSIRKVYYGLVTALLINEGVLPSIDTPVRQYVTAERFSNISSELTIRNLITHTHGMMEKFYPEGDITQTHRPGTEWHYNNAGPDLLCHVIENITGETIATIVGDRVFHPLGLKNSGWETNETDELVRDVHVPGEQSKLELGSSNGVYRNLFVSGRDILDFAVLHLRKGCHLGKQIIPKDIINMVTTCKTPSQLGNQTPKQGFYWWVNAVPTTAWCEIGDRVPPGSYQITGLNGSLCLVIPELDAVVIRLTNKIGEEPGYKRLDDFHWVGNAAVDCLTC